MRWNNSTYSNAADSSAQERDPSLLDEPWKPLRDNDDDGGDHTTEVDPEI